MITTEHLRFSYSGLPPYTLDDISLHFEKSAYVSILGENGCGKSTLVRLILGFLKPSSGRLEVRARRVGYVPQKNDFSNADFPITVFEMLDSYRRLLGIRDRGAVEQALARVRMQPFARRLMGALSGGQAQKIRLARALMGKPDLLVLDEPSTGVDIGSQAEIYSFLKQLNREAGVTVLSVEHNLQAAMSNSTYIYHLTGGHGHLCTPEHYAAEFLHGGEGSGNV